MTTQSKEVATKPNVSVIQKQITDDVLTKINEYRDGGLIRLPKNYSVETALKAAGIILQEITDKNNKPVLEVCTRESIARSLLKMITQGLSPLKKHGSFIVYGNQLNWQTEYDGEVAIAKRHGLKDIKANVVYKNDEFEFEVNTETGQKRVTKHKTALQNIDLKNIIGAYAITVMEDGSTDCEIMTMDQIRSAWEMGYGKGNTKAHNNFSDEMCKKTVLRRACKPITRRSDDSDLFSGDEEKDIVVESSRKEISDLANKEEVPFEDYEEVDESTGEVMPNKHQAEPYTEEATESNEKVMADKNGQATISGPNF